MKNKRITILLLCILLLLLPTAIVLANSMPPPFQIFLRFYDANQTAPEVKAVQLAGCADTECKIPEYLVEFGNCDSAGCYTINPSVDDNWSLKCAGNRCLFESGMNDIGMFSPMLKVVTDIGNEARVSKAVENPDCQYCTVAWKIDLAQPVPLVNLDEDFVDPKKAYSNFFTTYGFTIVVEVLVALGLFLLFSKKFSLTLKTWLPAILFANLLSYPVSWLVLPSFGEFQTDTSRRTAILVIVSVAVATTITLVLRWKKKPVSKGVLIALIIAIPVCAVLFMIGLLAASYGNYTVHVAGLSWTVVVILAEIFAVLFETFFVWLFLNKELKLHWVAVFVVIANGLSLLLGLLVF